MDQGLSGQRTKIRKKELNHCKLLFSYKSTYNQLKVAVFYFGGKKCTGYINVI